jgi:diguanylate cyclase (GGDEF)-like protein
MPLGGEPTSRGDSDGQTLSGRLVEAFLGGHVEANATLGFILVAAYAGVLAMTIEALRPTAHELTTFLVAGGASVLVALPLWRLRWTDRSPRLLLAFPLVALASLTIAAVVAPGIAEVYGGFFLLSFVYVGLTQPPGTSAACVILALPAWIVCQGHLSAVVDVKMPIAVLLWVIVGELLSHRVRSHARTAGVLAVAASTDPLTTLHNRRELERALARTDPGDAVVMLDLDGFKRVNDDHGHQAGDRILAELGRTIMASIRSGDVALRYGGDEVLLVLTRAGCGGAETFLQRLRSDWGAAPGRPTFSAGVAVHLAGVAAADTLRQADRALYGAKRAGGDTVAHAGGVLHEPAAGGVLPG